MNKINIIIITFFIISSCGSVKDAGKVLRNEKVKSSDEFLVKKKDPLELPPNFDEIPEPGVAIKLENKEEKINKFDLLKMLNKEGLNGFDIHTFLLTLKAMIRI